jgi:prophage regulatory protein
MSSCEIYRRKKVETVTGLPRSTLYQMVKDGDFPKPVRLGKRAVGWRSSDIEQWLAEREEVA